MSLGIGVIGAGVMGADHVRTIARHVAHAHVAAVYDFDPERARQAAEGPGARVITDAHALIADASVQAVVVASPDETHADYVLACIAAGKPALCEKPLAPATSDCLRVIEAEQAHGTRLVQVGYMRRFDPAYVEMKRQFESGAFGAARLLHSVHRNATVPVFFRSLMSITNAAVHEFDISRWLLGAEFSSIRVFKGRAPAGGTHDPLMLLLETDQGQLIDIEVFMKAAYGYEVRAELVCDAGTLSLAPPVLVEARQAGHQSFPYAADWRPRFATAYARQMQAWVDGIRAGVSVGASAWDGLVATLVAEAGVKAFESGAAEAVTLPGRPGLYS
jgi:myo-inositol 2-dehydrogenase/D-chiro-inositol 1-dehydrogenase